MVNYLDSIGNKYYQLPYSAAYSIPGTIQETQLRLNNTPQIQDDKRKIQKIVTDHQVQYLAIRHIKPTKKITPLIIKIRSQIAYQKKGDTIAGDTICSAIR